jgi:glutamyl-tRNA synthetase
MRFAPSPTSELHTQDLRTAIINYIVAKQKHINFIVRIVDGDKERNITGKDTEFMEILEKFALPHDAVSHQSENLHMHQTLAIRLLEEQKAFVCTCQRDESDHYDGHCRTLEAGDIQKLKNEKTSFVIRLKKPQSDMTYHDLIQGDITVTPEEMDDFIILREDGTPSPSFATACDDMLSGISLIIRDVSYLSDVPKQAYIRSLLGYVQETTYAHLPSILNEKGELLDLNDDGGSVKWLFEKGFVPDAIVNYIITLGYETPTEIFTMPEALEWFDINHISKSPVTFNLEKLRDINRKHLKMMDDRSLSTLFGFADPQIGKLAKLYLDEAATINELQTKIKQIFGPKDFTGHRGEQMQILSDVIFNAPMIQEYEAFRSYVIKESGLEGENFTTPLHYLLTGTAQGPELSAIYPLIKSYILEVVS